MIQIDERTHNWLASKLFVSEVRHAAEQMLRHPLHKNVDLTGLKDAIDEDRAEPSTSLLEALDAWDNWYGELLFADFVGWIANRQPFDQLLTELAEREFLNSYLDVV